MPFLLPFLPAIAGGLASVGAGAAVNALSGSGGQKGSGFQAQSANLSTPINGNQVTGAGYQVNQGLDQQNQLIQALQAQNGIQNQSQVYNQLQGVASGQGPNPAQAMLNQATGQNVSQQAALMAGQRGAGANTGLIARQAAQQGGALQQQALGQAATLQAQQSLGALGQAGNIAGQQVGNQMGAVQGYNAAAQGNQGQLLSALQGQNQANIQNVSQQNSANAGIANTNANFQNNAIGGIANGLGGVISQGVGSALGPSAPPSSGNFGSLGAIPQASNGNIFGVNTKFGYSQGGQIMPPHLNQIAELYHGNPMMSQGGMTMKQGGSVPGKAEVKGDSPENDTVDAKLSPGEVVIPRSVMESDDPVKGAADFVAALQKKGGGKDASSEKSDFKLALAAAIKNRKNK